MPVIGSPPRLSEAIAQLARLAREHRVELIAIGNGTASRETDRLCAELIRLHPELKLTKVVVSEAGASIYSASAFASQELPGLDQRVAFWSPICWERSSSAEGPAQFHRGVSRYPIPGAPVRAATGADLTAVYTQPSVSNVSIGSLYHDARRPAFVLIDELLAKNFAVLGATGSGKSCAVTLMLSAILTDHPNAHIVVLDPHNEYARAFGQLAEVVSVDNLQLPLWLFDFEEAVGALVRGGTAQEQEAQTIILKEAITRARRRHLREDLAAASITVDTPMPFGAVDLLRFIDEAMGTARCCRY
jgi:hypothetical protein